MSSLRSKQFLSVFSGKFFRSNVFFFRSHTYLLMSCLSALLSLHKICFDAYLTIKFLCGKFLDRNLFKTNLGKFLLDQFFIFFLLLSFYFRRLVCPANLGFIVCSAILRFSL